MIQAHSVGGGMQNMERGFQPVQMCSHAVLNASIFLAKNVTINILEGACQCTAESCSDVLSFLCCDMWTMIQGHFGEEMCKILSQEAWLLWGRRGRDERVAAVAGLSLDYNMLQRWTWIPGNLIVVIPLTLLWSPLDVSHLGIWWVSTLSADVPSTHGP